MAGEAGYRRWGDIVTSEISDKLADKLGREHAKKFVRIPADPRVKGVESFLAKAYSRGYSFTNPLLEILDKVGVRFVVLLLSDIEIVKTVVENSDKWTATLSRDFQAEQDEFPTLFTYQSVHYIVESKESFTFEGVDVPSRTPCEVQIRTLAQHAYSEMSHDSVYKPQTIAVPSIHRALSKSMALLESADEAFNEANKVVIQMESDANRIFDRFDSMYRETVKHAPAADRKADVFLLSTFATDWGAIEFDAIQKFLTERPRLGSKILAHSQDHPVFLTSAVLYAYYLAKVKPSLFEQKWPLLRQERDLIFSDVGVGDQDY